MKAKKSKKKRSLLEAEKIGWRKLRREEKPVTMSAEQCLEWLDGMRLFMFEVWKKNPELRKAYEKAKRLGFS